MAMYSALNGFATQRHILTAAAKTTLKKHDEYELFVDCLTVITRRAQKRHDFAHNIWGIIPEINNVLLLAQSKMFWTFAGLMQKDALKRSISADSANAVDGFPLLDRSKILVYATKDLLVAVEEAEFAADLAMALNTFLHLKGPARKRQFQTLFDLGEVRQARLTRLKQSEGRATRKDAFPPLSATHPSKQPPASKRQAQGAEGDKP